MSREQRICIGVKLKTLRTNRGLSRRMFCKEIDLHQSQVSLFETNLSVPTLVTTLRIARFFSVKVEDLIDEVQS